MTVPPLFGWEVILVVLVVVVLVGVAFLVVGSARASDSERSEWQAWLDARSDRSRTAEQEREKVGAPTLGEPPILGG